MNTLFLDLETIPTQRPGAIEEFRANVKPPGNMSKPETIAAWMQNNADAAAEDAFRKTSFDGAQGEILCIGFAVNDDTPCHIGRAITGCESTLLHDFYSAMSGYRVDRIVGHNVKDFDLRFLFQRSVINGAKPSFPLRTESRYCGDYVFDTMLSWAGWGNRISLKNLCAALGISVKGGDIDGSKVWDAAQDGRYEEIFSYCESDVTATREVYNRMTFGGEL
jgi:predicted PolB exonuclease-like 3'-5' exonuclease